MKIYEYRWLTGSGCFAFTDRFHDADDAAGLQGGLQPIGRVLHVGHVDAQAAVFTEKDHGGALLLVARRVTDRNHVLNLKGQRGVSMCDPNSIG